MQLDKSKVCVFIENEEQLEEMRQFLEGKGEILDNDSWFCLDERQNLNYLQLSYFKLWWLSDSGGFEEIKIEQFKKLW